MFKVWCLIVIQSQIKQRIVWLHNKITLSREHKPNMWGIMDIYIWRACDVWIRMWQAANTQLSRERCFLDSLLLLTNDSLSLHCHSETHQPQSCPLKLTALKESILPSLLLLLWKRRIKVEHGKEIKYIVAVSLTSGYISKWCQLGV